MALVFDYWAIGAGVLVLLALTFSFYEIIRHITNFTKPYLQRYIIRILFMVPIYSLNAWIAMILPDTGLYLDSLREQYIQYKPGPKQIFPFCCLPGCIGGRKFLIRCKHGILQYVVVRPITSLVAFTSQLFDFYGEGNYNPLSGYTYPVLLIVNNASQILAMYCLVIFYTGYQQELGPMRPLAKFFSIKLVVFFSFFQSVVISGLLEIDFVEETMRGVFPELQDKRDISRKAQELLICLDMLIAAIGHLFAFSYKPFTEPNDDRERLEGSTSQNHRSGVDDRSCCSAICSIFDFSEEKSDISEHFSGILFRIKQLFTFGTALPAVLSHDHLHHDQMNDDWMITRSNSQTDDDRNKQEDRVDKNKDDKQVSPINSVVTNYNSITKQ